MDHELVAACVSVHPFQQCAAQWAGVTAEGVGLLGTQVQATPRQLQYICGCREDNCRLTFTWKRSYVDNSI